MTLPPAERLDMIFGPGSIGATAEERAVTSGHRYVRSMIQLAFDSDAASGRRLSPYEALTLFGLDKLEAVAEDGSVGILSDLDHPAKTFRKRRSYLRIAKTSLGAAIGADAAAIDRAETPGQISPIQSLEAIAQALDLDERQVGVAVEDISDSKLGTRLRQLNEPDTRDDRFILALADAAWLIGRQEELARLLGRQNRTLGRFSVKNGDYAKPAYRTGYELAERTRDMVGLTQFEPIASIYDFAERTLGIPVVDIDLGASVAGATITTGRIRGIAMGLDEQRPLVRRMTLAHEIGHLLWDAEAILTRVRIDRINEMGHKQEDPVEIRANAFGIALLAPRPAVKAIYEKHGAIEPAVAELVEIYGISPSAAANHLKSVCELKVRSTRYLPTEAGLRKWLAAESRSGNCPAEVPVSRRGPFAELVLEACRRNFISTDTAATWLKIPVAALPA